jgi:hypothetical protein
MGLGRGVNWKGQGVILLPVLRPYGFEFICEADSFGSCWFAVVLCMMFFCGCCAIAGRW